MVKISYFEYNDNDKLWKHIRSFEITVEKFIATKRRAVVDRFYKFECDWNGAKETILTSHSSMFD